MPRPKTKQDLLDQTRQQYEKLQSYLAKVTPAQMTASGVVEHWSIKDVLAHLLAWQQMCLNWYRVGQRGETPATPSEQYNWRQIPELNRDIYEAHKDWPLDKVISSFDASHRAMLEAIAQMTESELFDKGVYAWTRSTTLGSYMTSATSSHYDWANKEIRRALKAWDLL
jgi:hypothetical protein